MRRGQGSGPRSRCAMTTRLPTLRKRVPARRRSRTWPARCSAPSRRTRAGPIAWPASCAGPRGSPSGRPSRPFPASRGPVPQPGQIGARGAQRRRNPARTRKKSRSGPHGPRQFELSVTLRRYVQNAARHTYMANYLHQADPDGWGQRRFVVFGSAGRAAIPDRWDQADLENTVRLDNKPINGIQVMVFPDRGRSVRSALAVGPVWTTFL